MFLGELLKEDDSLLRNTFFTTLRHHHPKLAAKLDVIFALSSAWSLTESDSDFSLLQQRLSDLNPSELILVRTSVWCIKICGSELVASLVAC